MNITELINLSDATPEFINGVALGALTAGIIVFVLVFLAAFYIYHALAWQKIARKQKHKHPWLAWIPFASTSLKLQLGNFHWAWVFLWLIPILGWIALVVLLTIAIWRIFEKEKYPGWLSLSYVLSSINGIFMIAYLVILGIVAWAKPKNKSKKK